MAKQNFEKLSKPKVGEKVTTNLEVLIYTDF